MTLYALFVSGPEQGTVRALSAPSEARLPLTIDIPIPVSSVSVGGNATLGAPINRATYDFSRRRIPFSPLGDLFVYTYSGTWWWEPEHDGNSFVERIRLSNMEAALKQASRRLANEEQTR